MMEIEIERETEPAILTVDKCHGEREREAENVRVVYLLAWPFS